jgi:sterol desaturase/sphingolipid hydroxylase (fatty acid hydroxylase superfamily)
VRLFVTVGVVLAAAIAMMVIERLRPGRLWPKVPGWWPRALLANSVQVGAIALAGVAWDPWLAQHRPWSADRLGLWGGALVGYLVHTFVYYWWHRGRHTFHLLWRWVHQFHHSPQRIEVVTSFYKHPLELFINGVLSSAILYGLLGLSPQMATLTMTINGLAELFYHWNVKTPFWIGYLIQRPESHCVHHQDGLHRHNYADLPVFDLVFGTFLNPRDWKGRCGFGPERELQVRALLSGRDVTRAGDP